ncbi:MAG: hypothetical protein WAO74_09315 [Polaribacter sp.]|uniref:hypothetical protein n=1 Tax=Polaribacter sp. TaxID=1920175 RepID=UPI003BB0BB40
MELINYIEILKNKEALDQVETTQLKSIVDEFPYFQSARALYLKSLKNNDSFKYNKELKITAAYTNDRAVLFDFITEISNQNKEKTKTEIAEIIPKLEKEKVIVVHKNETVIADDVQKAEQGLEKGKPIIFSKTENYSFNEWLQLSSKKPITRKEISPKIISEKEEIIEKFIQNNPKIEPLSKDKNIVISISKNQQDSSLMTETLAKVYLEQNKFENAIQAYRILSLKYPEKSGFFADQIKRIQILQKHK